MRDSFKDTDGIWKQLGASRSIEDALLDREHDDPSAIAREAAKEGISVEAYLHMRTNQEQIHRLRRIVRAGNEMVEAEKLRNPQKAKQIDTMLQASINGLLGLSPELDPSRSSRATAAAPLRGTRTPPNAKRPPAKQPPAKQPPVDAKATIEVDRHTTIR